jgi:hypothetical protein
MDVLNWWRVQLKTENEAELGSWNQSPGEIVILPIRSRRLETALTVTEISAVSASKHNLRQSCVGHARCH